MGFSRFAKAGLVLLLASGALFAQQTVEKFSASFTFPMTITSVAGKQSAPSQVSFFRAAGVVLHKGIFLLDWSLPEASEKGKISVYNVSGHLVKSFVITKNIGSQQCDLTRAAAGVYLAAISYGSYRQNIKLALYR
jgi:hypothetical protein